MAEPAEQKGWPQRIEYSTACWRLASRIRRMFGKDRLDECMGLNALFVRSPSIKRYGQLSEAVRTQIAEFCLPRSMQIAEAIQPRLIVLIGLCTGDLLRVIERDPNNPRILVGSVAGVITIAIPHPSSPFVSNATLDRAAERIRTLAGWN